jgi:hypothetical protein
MLTRGQAIEVMMAVDPDISRSKAEKWIDILILLGVHIAVPDKWQMTTRPAGILKEYFVTQTQQGLSQ